MTRSEDKALIYALRVGAGCVGASNWTEDDTRELARVCRASARALDLYISLDEHREQRAAANTVLRLMGGRNKRTTPRRRRGAP